MRNLLFFFKEISEPGRRFSRVRSERAEYRSLRYRNFLRHAERRIVIDPIHFLPYTDRNIIGLALLESTDLIGSVVCTEHDFRLCADHVLSLAILKHAFVTGLCLV